MDNVVPIRPGRKLTYFDKDGKTQQHFRDEVNINSIIQRYKKTGVLGDPSRQSLARKALYGDFTALDFFQAQNMIAGAQQAFMSLPATIRKRFNNDPGEIIAFLENDENRKEAEELGIIAKLPEVPVEKPEEKPAEKPEKSVSK